MKLLGFAALAALLLMSVPAEAGQVKFSDGPGSPGGEFIITVVSGNVGPYTVGESWVGFCLETTEYMNFSDTFTATIADYAHKGSDPSGKDPLSAESAYLYTKFSEGTLLYDPADPGLGGYDGTATDADALQRAFWILEDETYSGGTATQTLKWVAEAQNAVATGAWIGLGNVRVMNITNDSTGKLAQSQLIMVPVPAAGLLGIAMLSGLAVVRRIRRRRG